MIKTVIFRLSLFSIVSIVASCSSQDHFADRKYTAGQYHDLHLFREKTEKENCEEQEMVAEKDSAACILKDVLEELKPQLAEFNSAEVCAGSKQLMDHFPVAGARIDSVLAHQMKADTSWMQDSIIPRSVEVAFGSQGTMAIGTVGGLITMVAPLSIWFFWLPMVLVPVSLLVSLICAGVAVAKIGSGEIDKKYWKAIRLWAVCLLINLCIGSVVLIHYAAIL